MTGLLAGIAGARQRTVRLIFFMSGFGVSVWAITVPFTKIKFHLDDGTLGLMLLAGGTGGVLVMPFAGLAIARWGSRKVLITGAIGFGVLVPLLALAASPLIFTSLLFLYGALFGALDIAMNAQGAVVERQSGRLLMSGFHACYSLGTLGVAFASTFLLHLGISYIGCALVSSLAIFFFLSRAKHLLPPAEDDPSGGSKIALPNRATIVLGLCCFACFLTEGVCTDWSTIFLRFSRGMPLASAALGYAAFATTMVVARLGGDRVSMYLGQAHMMRLGCAVAVAGFMLVVLVPYVPANIAGFGLVGLGIGNIAPLVFSAAARVEGMAASHSVPAVVGVGYAGFLMGPVVIGFIANHFGLGTALGLNGLLIAATFFAAEAVAA